MDYGHCIRVFGRTLVTGAFIVTATMASAGDEQRSEIPHTGFENGRFWVTSRYRYEHVNQEFFADPARASTWRVRPGIESGMFYGFRVGVEGDFIAEVGADDFNNTVNGKTQFPVVVDVESAELNRAYLESHHIPGVVLTGGRYKADLDNWRFIGSVVWRQNDQTFDGGNVQVTAIPGVDIYYGYVANVNRIFSDDGPDGFPNDGNITSNVHIVNVKGELPGSIGSLTGYTYLLDLDDVDALSSASYGGFLQGKQKIFDGLTFNYRVEYARQTDYADQPLDYEADYWHVQPGLSLYGFTATLGYEKLGSDNGVAAFQTPLATGHKFNGFADVFLATPAFGLQDYYVDLTYKLKNASGSLDFLNGLLIKAQYHKFESDFGDIDYGEEFDLYVKQPIKGVKGLFLDLKYANYWADQFATDREKIIFGVGYNY